MRRPKRKGDAPKKRNPNDLTLRNLQALHKRLARIEAGLKTLTAQYRKTKGKV